MSEHAGPRISVVLSTRNRGEGAARTVRTILSNDYPSFDLNVVDQSDDDQTTESLRPFVGDARLRHIRSAARGLAHGRNLGISESNGELIAFTDDDCDVTSQWLRELATAFGQHARIGVVFGSVLPTAYDRRAGFVPAYVCKQPYLARTVGEKSRVEGIGACMGVRRMTWEALRGFDGLLGAGGRFRSGEDSDLAVRALLAGYFVYETPNVFVVHHGFRTWEEGRGLVEGYLYGLGATYAKLLKCGHWGVAKILLDLGWRWLAGQPIVDFNQRTPKLPRLVAFLQGAMAALRTPVNRTTGHFESD